MQGLKVLPKVEQDTQGASGPLKPESPEPSPAVQATLEIVQAPARAFLPIKNNRQALPPFVVQVCCHKNLPCARCLAMASMHM